MFQSSRSVFKLAAPAAAAALLGLVSMGVRADMIVSGGADKMIMVWGVDGAKMFAAEAHTSSVTAHAMTHDGKLGITAGADKKIKLWDTMAAKLSKDIDAHASGVTSIFVSSDDKKLYSGGADKNVKIWSLPDGKLEKTIDASGPVIGVVAIDGMIIVGVNDGDGKVKLFDSDGNSMLEIQTGHTGGLTVMAGSPTKQMLYTGGVDGKLKFWSQAEQGEFEGVQGGTVTGIFVLADGK